jgi:ribosomal protein L11 methyltransferase
MIRLAVRVERRHAELALAELLEFVPTGVEEVELSPALVEYAIYGAPGELPSLPTLQAAVGDALVSVSSGEVADDWHERWRRFHRPLVLDGRLTVRPPWEPAGSTPLDLVIDPGQAFGTGAHATTRLCLELLLELADAGKRGERGLAQRAGRPGQREEGLAGGGALAPSQRDERLAGRGALADLGCGSGVLAIAASALGFRPVLALDNDPAALAAARANATRNRVAIELRRCDLRTGPLPRARTLLANLTSPLLERLAGRLAALPAAARPDVVIASGLLDRDADRLASAFAAAGLGERERRVAGEWAALALARRHWPAGTPAR